MMPFRPLRLFILSILVVGMAASAVMAQRAAEKAPAKSSAPAMASAAGKPAAAKPLAPTPPPRDAPLAQPATGEATSLSPSAAAPVPAGTAPAASALPVIAPRPVSHILDESGMFTEAGNQALSARLLSSQTRTGLGLYLAIHTYLVDETPDNRASRTHHAWIEGQGAGVVVIHDRSTGRLSFAGSDDPRLPAAEDLLALYRLADAASRRLPPEATATERLTATLTSLADGLESWQKNGRLPTPVASPAVATTRPATEIPPANTSAPWARPAGLLVDEAGVFSDPAATALRSQLSDLEQHHALHLYIVTITYPPTGLSIPLAEKLALEWLPDGLGGVILFDRSRPDTLTFGGTPQVDRWLSSLQLKAIHETALTAALAAGESPALRLSAAAGSITQSWLRDGLPVLQESQRLLPRNSSRILPLVLLVTILAAGLLYLFQRFQERADRRRNLVFLFPEVYVPERLGAPLGGGTFAETPLPAPTANAGAPIR